MKLRTFMMCLGMSILYADKPASIFKTTATPAAAQSNYNKAIDAMLEENYDGMWKWYSVLDEKDRAKLLQELTTNKSPNDIPAQLHTIKTKINNLAAVITL